MPYKSIEDLPERTQGLPTKAKQIYLNVFNSVWESTKGSEEEKEKASARQAWGAVTKQYRKNKEGAWVKFSFPSHLDGLPHQGLLLYWDMYSTLLGKGISDFDSHKAAAEVINTKYRKINDKWEDIDRWIMDNKVGTMTYSVDTKYTLNGVVYDNVIKDAGGYIIKDLEVFKTGRHDTDSPEYLPKHLKHMAKYFKEHKPNAPLSMARLGHTNEVVREIGYPAIGWITDIDTRDKDNTLVATFSGIPEKLINTVLTMYKNRSAVIEWIDKDKPVLAGVDFLGNDIPKVKDLISIHSEEGKRIDVVCYNSTNSEVQMKDIKSVTHAEEVATEETPEKEELTDEQKKLATLEAEVARLSEENDALKAQVTDLTAENTKLKEEAGAKMEEENAKEDLAFAESFNAPKEVTDKILEALKKARAFDSNSADNSLVNSLKETFSVTINVNKPDTSKVESGDQVSNEAKALSSAFEELSKFNKK